MKPAEQRLDLDALRRKLDGRQGPAYWRSLEELAETDSFKELLHREFPSEVDEWNDPRGRRRVLKLMGASLAFAHGEDRLTVRVQLDNCARDRFGLLKIRGQVQSNLNILGDYLHRGGVVNIFCHTGSRVPQGSRKIISHN